MKQFWNSLSIVCLVIVAITIYEHRATWITWGLLTLSIISIVGYIKEKQ